MADVENLVLASLREHRAAIETRFDQTDRSIASLSRELKEHMDDNQKTLLAAVGYTILDRTGELLMRIEKLETRITELERR